jgi:hypothetical protein
MNAMMEVEELSNGVKVRVARGKAARLATVVTFEPRPTPTTVEGQGHAWLDAWGRWTRGDFGALGMPRRWVTDKAGEGGIAAGSPRPPTVIPDEEAKTDKAVAILALRNRSRLRWAIDLAYEKALPIDEVARALHYNRPRARALIQRACVAIYHIRITL